MRLSLLLALISTIILTLAADPVVAQNYCARIHIVDFGDISHWPMIEARYLKSAKNLSTTQQREQKIIYHAAFFFDYVHVQKHFVEAQQKGRFNVTELIRTYGDRKFFYTNKFEGPFANFVKTQEWLRDARPPVSIETLKEINFRMMTGRVLVKLTEQQKGNFREGMVSGNLNRDGTKITTGQIKNLHENLYLNFKTLDRVTFPSVVLKNDKVLERIRSQDAALAKEIEDFQASNKTDLDIGYASLEKRAMEALVAERFAWFSFERTKLGEISPKNSERYIELVAQFQRDLVSIHPFWDGNGRTTRVFMNYLLVLENIPPARLLSPDADLNESLSGWQAAVKTGIKNGLSLTADFAVRNESRLPITESPRLLLGH